MSLPVSWKNVVWSPKHSTRYKVIKLVSITIGNLFAIFEIYVGFLLGIEAYWLAFPLIGVSIMIAMVNDYAWTWVLEQIGIDKVKLGIKNGKKATKRNK